MKLYHLILCCSVSACGFVKRGSKKTAQTEGTFQVNGHEAVAGQAIVRAPLEKLQTTLSDLGIKASVLSLRADLDLFQLNFPGEAYESVEEAFLSSGIKIQPNHIVHALNQRKTWPSDPEFIRLWGLSNLGQNAPKGSEGISGADISALAAWNYAKEKLGTNGISAEKIVVAVIDSGIDYTHPDLADHIWVNQAELDGKVGIDDDGNGYIDDFRGWNFYSAEQIQPAPGHKLGSNDPMDDNGHGTHCAGTIGAIGSNAIGIVGVYPEALLMPIKFLSASGSGSTADAIRAIGYAVDQGANILSNSWGGGPYDPAMEAVIEDALEKNVLFVAAAGNDGKNNDISPSYPAGYKAANVVSVGASDNRDLPAFFSNFGAESVDVFAPGVGILSTVPSKTHNGESYAAFSGTSMATPHVAGAAAFLMAFRPDLKENVADLKKSLVNNSDYILPLASLSKSQGRINLLKALQSEDLNLKKKEWQESDFSYVGVQVPTHRVDDWIEVKKEKADSIKIHFASMDIDAPYDSLWLYDGNKRFVAELSSAERPIRLRVWSPEIKGEVAYLRFVNAKLMAMNVEVEQTDDEFTINFSMVDPYWNFHSNGFTIDKIAYTSVGEQK